MNIITNILFLVNICNIILYLFIVILYENQKIFHSRELSNTIYLEDELVRFPRSTHDDIIDALAYALDIIFPAKQRKMVSRSRTRYLYR